MGCSDKKPCGVNSSWCKNVVWQLEHIGFSLRWQRLCSVCALGSRAHLVFNVYFQNALKDGCLLGQFSPHDLTGKWKINEPNAKVYFSILVLSLLRIFPIPNGGFVRETFPNDSSFRFVTNFQVLSMGNITTLPGVGFFSVNQNWFFHSRVLQFKNGVFSA